MIRVVRGKCSEREVFVVVGVAPGKGIRNVVNCLGVRICARKLKAEIIKEVGGSEKERNLTPCMHMTSLSAIGCKGKKGVDTLRN